MNYRDEMPTHPRDEVPAGPPVDPDHRRIAAQDRILGEALRDLPVPEHGTAFFRQLEAGMDGIDARQAGRERATIQKTDAALPSDAASPPAGARPMKGTTSHRRRTPQRGPWLRLPGRLRLPLLVPAAALVLLAIVWAWGGPASPSRLWERLAVAPATAAEITQKLSAALAGARSLRAELVVVEPGAAGEGSRQMRWQVSTTASGDFRLSGANTLSDGTVRTEDIAYDASSGTERSYAHEGSDAEGMPLVFGGERRGLAAGPPDPGPSDWVLDRHVGSYVRALVAAQDPSTDVEEGPAATVQETTLGGREAWTIDTPVQPNLISGISGDRIEITVDRETGFPMKIVETRAGAPVREVRLENLEIDPAFSEDWFTLDFPAGMEVARSDEGFQRIDVADDNAIAAIVGYQPLLPAWLPAGFSPAEATAAADGGPTGTEGMNPPTGGVVSVAYRRGLDRFVVSLRPVGEDAGLWADPLASGEGFVDTPQTAVLARGAFAGGTAEVLVNPRAVPHLWAMNGDLVVTVAGDLSREELIAVAESLAPAPDAGPSTGD